jgi:hypothetical protein
LENDSTIEIVIRGEVNGVKISPQAIDIIDLRLLLDDINQLVTGGANPKERGRVTIEMKEGSFVGVVTAPPKIVATAKSEMAKVKRTGSVEGINLKRARVLNKWNEEAKRGDISFEIGLNGGSNTFVIDRESSTEKPSDIWVQAELYLFGEITSSGGKTNPNYHLDTDEYGVVIISAPKEVLRDDTENRNYRKYLVRVLCEQNLATGEIRNAEFKEWVDYFPEFNKDALDMAIQAGNENWKGVDSVDYIRKLRGNDA